jgi:hypothetical protein
MDVPDLLHMFEKTRGEKLDDDKLVARLTPPIHPHPNPLPQAGEGVNTRLK